MHQKVMYFIVNFEGWPTIYFKICHFSIRIISEAKVTWKTADVRGAFCSPLFFLKTGDKTPFERCPPYTRRKGTFLLSRTGGLLKYFLSSISLPLTYFIFPQKLLFVQLSRKAFRFCHFFGSSFPYKSSHITWTFVCFSLLSCLLLQSPSQDLKLSEERIFLPYMLI